MGKECFKTVSRFREKRLNMFGNFCLVIVQTDYRNIKCSWKQAPIQLTLYNTVSYVTLFSKHRCIIRMYSCIQFLNSCSFSYNYFSQIWILFTFVFFCFHTQQQSLKRKPQCGTTLGVLFPGKLNIFFASTFTVKGNSSGLVPYAALLLSLGERVCSARIHNFK